MKKPIINNGSYKLSILNFTYFRINKINKLVIMDKWLYKEESF